MDEPLEYSTPDIDIGDEKNYSRVTVTESDFNKLKNQGGRILWIGFLLKEIHHGKNFHLTDVKIIVFEDNLYFQEKISKGSLDLGFGFKKLSKQFITNTRNLKLAKERYGVSDQPDDHPDFLLLKNEHRNHWM